MILTGKKQSHDGGMCLIDTNAIIHTLTEPKFRINIAEHLKSGKPTLVVCAVVFYETSKPKKLVKSFWPGFSKAQIVEKLQTNLGVPVMKYEADESVKSHAKHLEKKHSALGLHWPDSIILAAALRKSWHEIITGDDALQKCCDAEGVKFFDQAIIRMEKKRKKKEYVCHVSFGNLPKFSSNMKKIIRADKSEEKIVMVFYELAQVWKDLKENGGSEWDENSFNRFFNVTIYNLQQKEPAFKKLEGEEYPSETLDKLFGKIDKKKPSYDDLLLSLKSKEDRKETVMNSWEKMLRD